MRKRILFAGISLFVLVAIAPFLVIALMNIMIFIADAFIFIVLALASLFVAALDSLFSSIVPRHLPIMSLYYCSTFFFIAIGISTAFLIGAIAFYVYKRTPFSPTF